MARFKHVESGVTVSVADDAELDSSWEPVKDDAATKKAAPAKKAAAAKPATK